MLSDYMTFPSPSAKVLSVLVTCLDIPSSRTGKTANDCNENELIQEVWYQLQQPLSSLPMYDLGIISPSNERKDHCWINQDSAFLRTPQSEWIAFDALKQPNLSMIGIQNGQSQYHFTSFEAAMQNAMQNAMAFLHTTASPLCLPQITYLIKISDVIYLSLFLLLLCGVLLIYRKDKSPQAQNLFDGKKKKGILFHRHDQHFQSWKNSKTSGIPKCAKTAKKFVTNFSASRYSC
jgi:hypothetical protein